MAESSWSHPTKESATHTATTSPPPQPSPHRGIADAAPDRWGRLRALLLSAEMVNFLLVGGLGYVVDVAAFNLLRSTPPFAAHDPSYARVCAVAAAMVVTYVGNRAITWRASNAEDRRREVALFVLFNIIGLGFSVLSLVVSHDLLGLTSRLADNLSANVVGVALGTVFRFWSYRTFVFAGRDDDPADAFPLP